MVYFVGAGCGAADLITLRGKQLIEKADLIIYAGSLVNPELLGYAKKDCRFLDSAKLTLDEVINAVLEADAAQKTIVRLHSGEPSLYGAVREQMDELDARGIRYESCPGVTACFGAAASLNMEFTLPDVSQSLVITRMAGKTAVPDAESIESFAAHHASMAVYLSSGMTKELSKRLIAGGYAPETPAAIVYKASWPDEKAFVCTVGSLPEVAAANSITKTAVILVGDCVAHYGYSKSRLYAPDFETEFRKKKPEKDDFGGQRSSIVYVCSFTEAGRALEQRLRAELPEVFWVSRTDFCSGADCCGAENIPAVRDFAEKAFNKHIPLVFIGAAGIATRISADFIKDKFYDSPVVVIDERGQFVIPLLSGHMGGANELAQLIANRIGAVPVITTASDVAKKFAVDVFARRNGFSIVNREEVKHVTGKLLGGEKIRVWVHPDVDFAEENIPEELAVVRGSALGGTQPPDDADIVILADDALHSLETDKHRVVLVPKLYCVGMGCKKDKPFEELLQFFEACVPAEVRGNICAIASIDLKKTEKGLLELAQYLHVPFVTYTAQELAQVPGEFSESDFVREQIGVSNVCERAAVMCAGASCAGAFCSGEGSANCSGPDCTVAGEVGNLVCKKTAGNGITVAVAKRKPKIVTWRTEA
ncbi:MAG: precorrin-4 C(11)-methyltransferase [Spirochaetaceae bacterium]|nr:precorrin-4 C(11)-methyltransferase [Spirochaetaceae bacterium]